MRQIVNLVSAGSSPASSAITLGEPMKPKIKEVYINKQSMSLFEAVFLVFLILKLTDTIDWSWWWVTAPIWGPIVLLLSVTISILVVAGLVVGVQKIVGLLR